MEIPRALLKLRSIAVFHPRLYSQYSPDFRQPVYREEKQKKLFESGEAEIYRHSPIKAARTDETSSIFRDIVLSKFINYIMESGRKQTARQELDKCFEIIKKQQLERYHKATSPEEKAKIITEPLRLLKMAVNNCRPILKLIPMKRGGATYQVPAPITDVESVFRSMRWLVLASRDKEGPTPFAVKLAYEIMDAAENRGRVVKQKTDLHKTCEANRAYAHFRWT